MNVFTKDVAERTVRTFLQGYLGSWLATGADFDTLVSGAPLKVGFVSAALSISMSLGLKNVGSKKDSPSVL